MTRLPASLPTNLPPPSRAAYLLDFDGTLVDIAPAPELVWVDPGLKGALLRLRGRCGNALAILTGRPIEQVEAFLPGVAYAIAGEHGTALRHSPGSAPVIQAIDPMPAGWLAAAKRLVAVHPGAMLEGKRHGFALHYRAAPDSGPALGAALRAMAGEAPGRYEVMAAKMAWELRPAGVDKGSALRALMAQPPFAGRVPVFVGDDVTDEDAIKAAHQLGGVGLRVDEAFITPAGVRAWISSLT